MRNQYETRKNQRKDIAVNAVQEAFMFMDEPISVALAPDLDDYDRYLVAFSGGKDSVACVLHLLECGVPAHKIELHHHLIDGREGSTLMDWPVTEAYCQAFAKAFGMKLYFSWRQGGFEREMLRDGARTAPVAFDSEDGTLKIMGGDRGKEDRRLRFPQQSSDLSVRWCSSYGKIDVFDRLLRNEARFRFAKTLVVTGERAEESTARAKYKPFEPHRADRRRGKAKRHVDVWRAVHSWQEEAVWAIMERHLVNPHPAYWIGWGRLSCRSCIFGSPSQWATIRKYMPHAFIPIANYEQSFGCTINRSKTVNQLADAGTPYECDPEMLKLAESTEYTAQIIVPEWHLPPGAFKENAGPT